MVAVAVPPPPYKDNLQRSPPPFGVPLLVLQAGADAGMMAVAVPRRLALQGTYPGVAAKVEGYGPGYCTWGRLRSMLKARSEKLS